MTRRGFGGKELPRQTLQGPVQREEVGRSGRHRAGKWWGLHGEPVRVGKCLGSLLSPAHSNGCRSALRKAKPSHSENPAEQQQSLLCPAQPAGSPVPSGSVRGCFWARLSAPCSAAAQHGRDSLG